MACGWDRSEETHGEGWGGEQNTGPGTRRISKANSSPFPPSGPREKRVGLCHHLATVQVGLGGSWKVWKSSGHHAQASGSPS